jgi:hypothetical protein
MFQDDEAINALNESVQIRKAVLGEESPVLKASLIPRNSRKATMAWLNSMQIWVKLIKPWKSLEWQSESWRRISAEST